MATELDPQAKLVLIKENLQEVLKPEILEDVIIRQARPLKIYWGVWTQFVYMPCSSPFRDCHHRETPLCLLRAHGQNRPFLARWL